MKSQCHKLSYIVATLFDEHFIRINDIKRNINLTKIKNENTGLENRNVFHPIALI